MGKWGGVRGEDVLLEEECVVEEDLCGICKISSSVLRYKKGGLG